jgi:hypothetical protein
VPRRCVRLCVCESNKEVGVGVCKWVSGCAGVQIYTSAGVWVCMCRCAGIQVYSCACVHVLVCCLHSESSTLLYICANLSTVCTEVAPIDMVWVYGYMGIWVYGYMGMGLIDMLV